MEHYIMLSLYLHDISTPISFHLPSSYQHRCWFNPPYSFNHDRSLYFSCGHPESLHTHRTKLGPHFLCIRPGDWFIPIKMPSYQYSKSHCGEKTILQLSYLHNRISYTGKTAPLYWIRGLALTVAATTIASTDWTINREGFSDKLLQVQWHLLAFMESLLTGLQRVASQEARRWGWRGRAGTTVTRWSAWSWAGRPPGCAMTTST